MRKPRDPLAFRAVELRLIRGERVTDFWREVAEEFGISRYTVREWATLVRKQWATEEERYRPERRAQHRQRLQYSWNQSLDAGDYRAAATVLQTWQKFDGLDSPTKVEHTVSGHVDVRAMTPLERQAEIDRLQAKREAALGRLPVVDVAGHLSTGSDDE